jgi:hypothetical protein
MAAGFHNFLARQDIRNAIYAATDVKPSDEMLDMIISKFSSKDHHLSLDEFRSLLTCGLLFPQHIGR